MQITYIIQKSRRRSISVSIMADNKVLVKVPPTLMFGRAINYALSAWNHLLNYLDCPELFVDDNSIAERSIKPFVIGRKNWLFSGSETGAESSCFLFTLIDA